MKFIAADEADSERIGRAIARTLPRDAVVHLVGDLGAGKTFLARAIAAELGADPHEVASPSFAIVHEYPRPGAGVNQLEWPKEAVTEFEDGHVEVRIRVREDGAREIEVELESTAHADHP